MPTHRDVIADFLVSRFPDQIRLAEPHRAAIYWHGSLWDAAEKAAAFAAERLAENPPWGLVRQMIIRSQSYTGGALALSAGGDAGSAEALSRACMESSVNVLYVLAADPMARLYSYFESFFEAEFKQNEHWRQSLHLASEEERPDHLAGLEQKETAYRTLPPAETFAPFVTAAVAKPWPNVFDRFRLIGRELDYRTYYAAACSQAHNDAEDLLNVFVVKSLGMADLEPKLADETSSFSRLLVFTALQYHAQAIREYALAFGLQDVAALAADGVAEIGRLCAEA